MFVIITTYEEFGTGNLTIRTQRTDNGRVARETFCAHIADHDCAACVVLDTLENNRCVFRYDQDRFEYV